MLGKKMKIELVNNFKVYRTKDYTMFHHIKGNRPVKLKQVNRLVALMQDQGEHSLSKYWSMTNQEHGLIDGQHRLAAAERLNHYFYFFVCPDSNLNTVININSTPLKWDTNDYLGLHCEEGNAEYLALKKFSEYYKVAPAIAQSLLSGSNRHEGIRNNKAFKTGKFSVTSYQEATVIMDWVIELEPYYNRAKSRAFVKAIQALFYTDDFNFDRLLRKFQLNIKIERQPTSKKYLAELQRLYNTWERKENWMLFVR